VLRKRLSEEGGAGYWQAWYEASRHAPMDEGLRARRLAAYCSRLGRKDEALRWLEKAIELRDSGMVYLNVSPAFASIRQDPGFQKLIRRVAFMAATIKAAPGGIQTGTPHALFSVPLGPGLTHTT